MKRLLVFIFAVAMVAAWVAPSFAADMTFGGTYRVRAFWVDNDQDGDDNVNDFASWTDQRFRFNVKAQEGSTTGFFQLQMGDSGPNGSHTWGSGGFSADAIAVRQAYLAFPVGPLKFKMGRTYASHPFKGILFQNIADRIIIGYKPEAVEGLNIVFIHAKAKDCSDYLRTGATGTAGCSNTANDNDAQMNNIGFVYAPPGAIAKGAARFYYQRNGNFANATDDRYWLAGTIDFMPGPYTLSLTGAWLTGSKDDVVNDANDLDYKSYAFDIRGSMDLNELSGMPLVVGATFGYGTGDDDANDKEDKAFHAPAAGASYINTDIFFDAGENGNGGTSLNIAGIDRTTLGNITWAGIWAKYKATDRLGLTARVASFWRTEENQTGGTSYKDDELGQELDLDAVYKLAKGLDLVLQGAWFFTGDGAFTQSGQTVKDDTVTELFAKVEFNF